MGTTKVFAWLAIVLSILYGAAGTFTHDKAAAHYFSTKGLIYLVGAGVLVSILELAKYLKNDDLTR